MAEKKKKQPKLKAKKTLLDKDPASEIIVMPNDPTPTKASKMGKYVQVKEARNLLVEYVFGVHAPGDRMNPYSLNGVDIGVDKYSDQRSEEWTARRRAWKRIRYYLD